jgi:HTH-like domain
MGQPRSTFYDAPIMPVGDHEIVARITAICDEFEAYGYRRVGAERRHQGVVVNGKKLRRLMREHDLPKRRRHYAITTDSDHDSPIFADLAKAMGPGMPRSIDDARIEAVIVHMLESQPPNATHWSSRGMAKASGLSVSSVQRIWRVFGLQPHRLETFKCISSNLS